MRFLSILLMMCILFCCGLHGKAQSNHVYEDSSILYPDEQQVAAPAVVEEQQVTTSTESIVDEEFTTDETYYRDTFIVSNRHVLSPDSIRLLKNDKQFLYAKNLDSLLKDMKKKEEAKERKRQLERERERSSSSSSSDEIRTTPSVIEGLFNSTGLQFVLWGLAALFVLFVIYKLAFAEGGFRKKIAESNVKVLEEEDATPTPGKNFDPFIAKAVSENNYRLAVRYLYLQLLQKLTAAGAIEFAVDKTNTEYLRELTGKPYKEEVTELTRYYDYVWYGEFEMNAELYTKVESKFKNVAI